jgi:hypothetical protein
VVAVFHPVVQVQIAGSAKRLVVEACQSQALSEVFLKIVQGVEMGCLCGFPAASRCLEEFLESAVHQKSDFVSDDNAGFTNLRMGTADIPEDSTAIAVDDFYSALGWLRGESGLFQKLDVLVKREDTGFLPAKEHVPFIIDTVSLVPQRDADVF